MPFNSVTITPTLDTSAYADGDVLFVGTELKMPHRNCKLLSVQAVWDDTEAQSEAIGLYFFAENNTALGTINSAANISAANIAGNVFLGYVILANGTQFEAHLGTPTVLVSGGFVGDTESEFGANPPIVLTAGKGGASSPTSIFVQGILEKSGGITCGADSLKMIFHFEY